MKMLLTQIMIVCAGLTIATSGARAAEGWGVNYEKAAAQAKAEKKLLLLDFTGSDWCPYCIHLDKEVFSQAEFKEYAAKNLVLLEVDFPQIKAQPSDVKAQNARLQEKYGIEGLPTVVVLNSDGKKVGQLQYQPGGVKPFLAELEKIKK